MQQTSSILLLLVALVAVFASSSAPPTSMTANPCYGMDENDCKINEDNCDWNDGCYGRQKSPSVQRTRNPSAFTHSDGQCRGMNKANCQTTPDCLPLPGVGCRGRPTRPRCAAADRANAIQCHIDARIALRRMFNFTFNASKTASPGVKLQLEQDLFCNFGPQAIFNVSAHCVHACYDDDDNMLGLPDAEDWCQEFNNGTALDAMLAKLNCNVQRSCDQMVAAGLAANAEVAPLLGSNGVIIRISFAVAATMAAAWVMMM